MEPDTYEDSGRGRTYVWGVSPFANSAPPPGGDAGWPSLLWLAGLLEGEGTFLKPVPSAPGRPIISCRMTDLDVVELVAAVFGTSVQAADKGPHRTEYIAMIRGSRAARLMRILRPMMSERRQASIDRALDSYTPPGYKLSFEAAEEIRRRYREGATISSLGRGFGVSRPTIRAVVQWRVYPLPDRFPWLPISWAIRGVTAAGTGLNWKELYWLAGWLEGEGSFTKPPPSRRTQPRIQGGSSDEDVIQEVARLLRVKPRLAARRHDHWSPYWSLIVTGGRAVTLMQAIAPAMGKRRSRQIQAAIDATRAAGGAMGWMRSNRAASQTA